MSKAYDILEHGMMVGDRVRLDAYLDAIRRVVHPGSVVADIGSGSGVFAVAACQAGARRVYAVEPGDIIQVAREIAIANGCADRIEFVQQFSTDTSLPEPADVIVLDVRSVLPDEQIPVAIDARRRLLKRGGIIVPSRDALWASVVSSPSLYQRHVGAWDSDPGGLDVSPIRTAAVNRGYKCRVAPEQLVCEPKRWATIDYGAADDVVVAGSVEWTVSEPIIAHGVVAWFETTLAEGVTLSNRPGNPALLYGQQYFPWASPKPLAPGQNVRIEFRGSGDASLYQWDVVTTAAGTVR